MLRLAGSRLAAGVPIVVFLALFVFVLVDLAPGDAAVQLAGENASPELIGSIRRQLRLDDPLPVRFARWLASAVRGDLGESLRTGENVRTAIVDKIPISLSIAGVALILSGVLGVVFGTAAALRRGRVVDRVVTSVSSVLIALPPFVIALVLVVQLAVERHLFPSIGYVSFSDSPSEWIHHLILPGLSLSAYLAAEIALQLRASLIDTLDREFVLAARARGIAPARVVFKHAARTAAVPVITVVGLRLGMLIGGTVIVEQVFATSGIGTLAVTATRGQDINMLLGIVIFAAIVVLVVNVVVDIVQDLLNPKLRTG